ncbi:MAG: hypothetical protein H3C34_20850 [Caldilineaceae bacterium]|nr:hypothetical protein [Caldilineaceae bacterium]
MTLALFLLLGFIHVANGAALRKNLFNITYTDYFLNVANESAELIRRFNRLQEGQPNTSDSRTNCRINNARLVLEAARLTDFNGNLNDSIDQVLEDPSCVRIATVGSDMAAVMNASYLNWEVPVTIRDQNVVEFRTEATVWGPILAFNSANYDLTVSARTLGSGEGQLRIIFAGHEVTWSFPEVVTERTMPVTLEQGLYWIRVSFIGDYASSTEDRNLRLYEIRISQQ